jgi:Flp pilus assembly protein TadD
VVTWTRDVRPLVPWFAIGMAAGVMTIWMERTFIGAQGDTFDFTLIERTLIAGRAVVFYLTTLVWPANLAFSYPRWQVSQAIWWQYLFPVAVMAVMVGLWMLRRWSRAPLAALLLFGVTLGPALGFVNVYPFAYSFVADHFQYLACAGVIALASAGLVMASNRWAKSTMPALGVVLLIPLALITWRDSHAYVSAEVLYRTTIDRNPDASMAHNNLAGLLLDRQPPAAAEALVHARAAVALAPQRASTHFNLGLALEASGDPTGAAEAYRAAIAHTSAMEAGAMRVAEIYERLAGVLHASGRREEAVAAYQSALALDPLSADTHNDLGVALAELRRFREAEPHFAEAVRLKPDDAQAKDNLVRTRQIIQRGGR